MSSIYRIEANRANAQKSTGPRTPEGKTASSMNALKHGADARSAVIPGEDPAAYDAMAAGYQSDLQPTSPLEQFQVEIMIRSHWQHLRLEKIEDNIYRELLSEGVNPDAIEIKVLRDSPTGKLLIKVWSQLAALERASTRALAELRRIRAEKAAKAAAQPVDAAKPEPPTHNEPNSAPKSTPHHPVDEVVRT